MSPNLDEVYRLEAKRRKCLCDSCSLSRAIGAAITLGLIQSQQRIIILLANRLASAEEELCIAKMQLKGEWPTRGQGC